MERQSFLCRVVFFARLLGPLGSADGHFNGASARARSFVF
jgi:hypothetical protein